MRVCSEDGCPVLVEKGRCSTHAAPIRHHERRHYTGIPGVNYGRKWQRAAKEFLSRPENVWCRVCPGQPQHVAEEVDHVIPHRGDELLFWDEKNWQPACKQGHSRKTATEVRA